MSAIWGGLEAGGVIIEAPGRKRSAGTMSLAGRRQEVSMMYNYANNLE